MKPEEIQEVIDENRKLIEKSLRTEAEINRTLGEIRQREKTREELRRSSWLQRVLSSL